MLVPSPAQMLTNASLDARSVHGVQSHLKLSVALNPMYRIFQTLPKVVSHPAYQNSITRTFHRAVFEM